MKSKRKMPDFAVVETDFQKTVFVQFELRMEFNYKFPILSQYAGVVEFQLNEDFSRNTKTNSLKATQRISIASAS